MSHFWYPRSEGSCANYNITFLVTETLGTILDVIILLLPVKLVSALQMLLKSRIQVSAIFLLGGLYAHYPLITVIHS